MILMVEPNQQVRIRLCQLTNRERIIGVDSYSQTLEMLCKFKNDIHLMIVNIRLLNEIHKNQTLFKLCDKLYIEVPPILAICRKGDEMFKEKFERKFENFACIDYDGEDTGFPERYIKKLKRLFPDIIADIASATDIWLRGEPYEPRTDPKEWLREQGFLDPAKQVKIDKIAEDLESIMPLIQKMIKTAETQPAQENPDKEKNYKKMYEDLEKKYDLLVQYIREIGKSAKKI